MKEKLEFGIFDWIEAPENRSAATTSTVRAWPVRTDADAALSE